MKTVRFLNPSKTDQMHSLLSVEFDIRWSSIVHSRHALIVYKYLVSCPCRKYMKSGRLS